MAIFIFDKLFLRFPFSEEERLKNRVQYRRGSNPELIVTARATLGKREPQPLRTGGWAGFACWSVPEHSSVTSASVRFLVMI
jgi:hypothetical protein